MRFQLLATLLVLSITTSQAFFLGFGGPLLLRNRILALRALRLRTLLLGGFPLVGKRSMENETLTNLPVLENTESFCFLNSSALMTSTLNCNGPVHNFECQVERQLNLEHTVHELESLRIMPVSFKKNTTVHEHVILSFSKEDSKFNNFTLSHDDSYFVFAFFHDETIGEEGFRIKDLECWEEFEEMITHDEQVELKLSLTL